MIGRASASLSAWLVAHPAAGRLILAAMAAGMTLVEYSDHPHGIVWKLLAAYACYQVFMAIVAPSTRRGTTPRADTTPPSRPTPSRGTDGRTP